MNFKDSEKLARLRHTIELNYRLTNLYALYLERCPEAITADMIKALTSDGYISEKEALVALVSELFSLDDANGGDERKLIRDYITKSVQVLDTEKYKNNPIFDSYMLYTADWKRPGFNRSFDLTAVQFAFEGEGDIYSLMPSGRLEFFNEAPQVVPNPDATKFVECEGGNIRFMVKEASDEYIAASLQQRMDEFNK